MSKFFWIALIAATAGAGYVLFWPASGRPPHEMSAGGAGLVEISVPPSLSANAEAGKTIFDANCAKCHGANAVGEDGMGPPLVHKIYEPSHHGDEAFQRAVALGVRQHHWRFGNMQPVEGLGRQDVEKIIDYIRELQRANGIS